MSDKLLSVSARPFDPDAPQGLTGLGGHPVSLLLDAAAYEGLPARLDRSGLEHTCLFGAADEAALPEESPYLVQLDGTRPEASANLLNFARSAEEGVIALACPVPLGRQRAHWRKWLSVYLPESQSQEDKPVLFRFYDTAIMAAFLGTLGPEDAAAFFGPVETIVTLEATGAQAFTLTPTARLATPRPFPPGGLYRINDAQYAILANVTADAFRQDLFRFLRSEYSPETRDMTDAQVWDLIDAGIADGTRMEDKRQGSILSLVVIRLLRPDLLEDKFVMNQVMKDHPLASDPKQRVGLLQGYLTIGFADLEEHDAYFARLAKFWQGEF